MRMIVFQHGKGARVQIIFINALIFIGTRFLSTSSEYRVKVLHITEQFTGLLWLKTKFMWLMTFSVGLPNTIKHLLNDRSMFAYIESINSVRQSRRRRREPHEPHSYDQ